MKREEQTGEEQTLTYTLHRKSLQGMLAYECHYVVNKKLPQSLQYQSCFLSISHNFFFLTLSSFLCLSLSLFVCLLSCEGAFFVTIYTTDPVVVVTLKHTYYTFTSVSGQTLTFTCKQ